jgi:voltage-gated potassium channel
MRKDIKGHMDKSSEYENLGVYDLFISALAIVAVILISGRMMLSDESKSGQLIDYFDYGICAIFFYDFIRSMARARNKWRYFYTWGWFDLLASLPAVSFLRYFRVVRLIRVLRILRSIRILVQVTRRDRSAALLAALILFGIMAFIGICIGVLKIESGTPGSHLNTPEDVLWWAVVTCSTVGYGDEFPVTNSGRLLASFLMVIGIGAFATATSGLGVVFKRWQQTKRSESEARLEAKMDEMGLRLQNIESMFEQIRDDKLK